MDASNQEFRITVGERDAHEITVISRFFLSLRMDMLDVKLLSKTSS